jgi:hypothetical protein
MARRISLHKLPLKITFSLARAMAAVALVCAQAPPLRAQHGGGHAGGGGHSSGGGGAHASAPHVSAPPATHFSGPPPAGAGTRSFVTVPPAPRVRLATRPGVSQPVVGNHVGAMTITPSQPIVMTPPRVVIGFPQSEGAGRFLSTGDSGSPAGRAAGALSFSGEGHEIWRNPAPGNDPGDERHPRLPVRPVFPRRPIPPFFGGPVFVGPRLGFGGPFIGLGWGFGAGFNSWWACDPYAGLGYGCNAFPYYDSGYGSYGNVYAPGSVPGSVPDQNQPQLDETQQNGEPAPLVYGGGELVQLCLKDGTVYDVTDYWLVNDNELHFTTVDASGNATDHVVGFDQLNLQKTIDVNTGRGYRFVLRNEPMREYMPGTGQNAPPANAEPASPSQPLAPQAPPVPAAPAPRSPAQLE